MKKTQTEIVRSFIKKHGSITPSNFSVNIDGTTLSYESFCRRLRDLDNVEKTKNSKGNVTYHWKREKDYEDFVAGGRSFRIYKEANEEETGNMPQLTLC